MAIQAASSISSWEKPFSRAFLMWLFTHGSHLASTDRAMADGPLGLRVERAGRVGRLQELVELRFDRADAGRGRPRLPPVSDAGRSPRSNSSGLPPELIAWLIAGSAANTMFRLAAAARRLRRRLPWDCRLRTSRRQLPTLPAANGHPSRPAATTARSPPPRRCRSRASRAKSASAVASGDGNQQSAGGLRVEAEVEHGRRRRSRRRRSNGADDSRFRSTAPGDDPVGQALQHAGQQRADRPRRSRRRPRSPRPSRQCPIRPKPVTSVQAWAPNSIISFGGPAVERGHRPRGGLRPRRPAHGRSARQRR